MDDTPIPARDPHCVEEVLEGEIVLYGGASLRACYLNESASMVWMLIDGERSVGTIIRLLGEAYPDAEDIAGEVRSTLAALLEHGAIRVP